MSALMLAKAAATKAPPVVVVGGGLLGAATAYHVSSAGLPVVVLEREQIGAGATSRSAGLMLQVSGSAEKTAMVRQTLADAEALEAAFGEGVCGLRRSGSLRVAVAAARVGELEAEAALAAAAGVDSEWLSPADAKARVPWLEAPEGSRICHVPSDGLVDPVALASAYLRAAAGAAAPAKTLVGYEATGLALDADAAVAGVEVAAAAGGDDATVLPARAVVDCAGLHSGDLADAPMPFAPTRSHYWLCAGQEELLPADHPSVLLPDARAYARSEGPGRLLLGLQEPVSVTVDPTTLDRRAPQDAALVDEEGATAQLLDALPGLAWLFPAAADSLGVEHYVAGWSTYTPDGGYALGAPAGAPPGYVGLSGCNGTGASTCGGIGRLAADLFAAAAANGATVAPRGPGLLGAAHCPQRFGSDVTVTEIRSERWRRRCAESRGTKFRRSEQTS